MIILVSAPQAFAHTHRVLTINGQQVEFVVGWVIEPPYVDEVNAIDFWAHYVNATCPQGTVSTSCPVYGLDQSLQVQVITGGQSQVLTFAPNLSNDVPPVFNGEYTANIEPTVAGSYSFRIFGNVNNVPVNETFTCGPTTFECVDPPSEVQFPQQIPAGHDLQVGLANLQSQVTQLQSDARTAYTVAGVGVVVGIIGIAVGAAALTRSKKRR
ncbi:MAG: hypothetical protein ABSA50_04835 [Candidatus Bathyarchaeia archaeon]